MKIWGNLDFNSWLVENNDEFWRCKQRKLDRNCMKPMICYLKDDYICIGFAWISPAMHVVVSRDG